MRTIITLLLSCLLFTASAQVDTINWVQHPSLPSGTPRTGSAYFLIDSDFYVAGGQLYSGNEIGEVWQYHIPTDTWIRKNNLPFGPASSKSYFVLNNKGYLLTDRDSIMNDGCDTMFWAYDPSTDQWTRKAEFPDAPRNNGSSFSYSGKGYVGQTYGCSSADTHFWQYDPSSNMWAQVASLPTDITSGSISIATMPGNAYLIGGTDITGFAVSDLWRYNTNTNLWDSLGQMPGSARIYPVVWSFDSLLMAGGGANSKLYNDFYLYNIAQNNWQSVVFQNSFG